MTTATGSPTYRTVSTASSGSAHTPPIGAGASLGSPAASGGGGVRSSMSPAVSTAITPGSASASLVSMPVMRAWATGLRTKVSRAAAFSSGVRRSSTYTPPAVSSRGSSVRITRVPMMLIEPPQLGLGLACRQL